MLRVVPAILRFLPAAASAAVLSSCGEDPLSSAERRDLEVAEARWAARGFADYAFVTRRICFCTPEALLRVEIEVRGGIVASVTDVVADTLLSATLNDIWYTVDDLFETIRRTETAELLVDVEVAFDPDLGYPTLFSTEFGDNVADAGVTIEVTALRALEPAPPTLVELAPGFPYATWFTEHTGFDVDPDHFGAYGIQPIGGTLFFGFGSAIPAVRDGALLAAFDNAGLGPIGSLDEQGFLDMTAVDGMLLVPGVDPCCPDGWESGNVYTYSATDGLIKLRNMPNVVHGWGAWYDAPQDVVYLAVSSHPGDFVTTSGEIWRSSDRGASWERIAAEENGIGDFRTYDVVRRQERLYAVRAQGFPAASCELVVEPEAGSVWQPVFPGATVACIHRLVVFDDHLIALDETRGVLQVLAHDGGVRAVDLPFAVHRLSLNWATVAGEHLVAISDDGRILRTRDLTAWDTVAEPTPDLMAIAFWPHRAWLVVAGRGADGGLWRLRLCGAAPC